MRFARHVLLPEIGEYGQARLTAARVDLRGAPAAADVAQLYLERAGVTVVDAASGEQDSSEPARIHRLMLIEAGRPELEPAAAFLTGALAAVECIKATVNAGVPAQRSEIKLTGPSEERG